MARNLAILAKPPNRRPTFGTSFEPVLSVLRFRYIIWLWSVIWLLQDPGTMQLLFFDTFSHDTASLSDLNLDLVQFPSPVTVREVRIIPLGARVSANFPGGVRLGATNPTKFDLEFFVNNLRAPGASTFESLGVLQYNQNGTISMVCNTNLATDGLVLRGRYAAITLAVYGQVAEPTPTEQPPKAAVINKNAVDHMRIKEEPVRPPESPVPDGNGRTIGESYAAVWTAKHSEEALKAEPPEEWMEPEGNNRFLLHLYLLLLF